MSRFHLGGGGACYMGWLKTCHMSILTPKHLSPFVHNAHLWRLHIHDQMILVQSNTVCHWRTVLHITSHVFVLPFVHFLLQSSKNHDHLCWNNDWLVSVRHHLAVKGNKPWIGMLLQYQPEMVHTAAKERTWPPCDGQHMLKQAKHYIEYARPINFTHGTGLS